MIIDSHTHIFDEKTYEDYVLTSKNKIEKALVLHYWRTVKTNKEIIDVPLDSLVSFTREKKDLFLIASIDIDKDIGRQLKILDGLFQKGKIFGIKMYPGYQHFYPSDKKIYPIARLCQKYNKPLIFHSGDVFDFEQKAILKYSHPIHIDGLAVQFPECKIVIAHFGFPYHMETANVVSKNKNVYTEISGTIDDVGSGKNQEMLVNQYAKDLKRVFSYYPNIRNKVMFGSDYGGEDTPLNTVIPYVSLVKKIFTPSEQKRVFYQTAEKIFFE